MNRLLLLISMFSMAAGAALGEGRVDFGKRVTPRCKLAALVALPPSGWFNVPFEDPAKGNLGCLMVRTNEREEPVGMLRIRSLAAPALPENGKPFQAIFISEVEAVQAMGFVVVDEKPLFLRNDVPVKGEGFRDGRGVGLAARIEGNAVPQEIHLLMFRSDRAEYIVTLLTPARSHDEKMWKRNTDDFGTVIRTLEPITAK